MDARRRVRRARALLAASALGKALLWAACAAALTIVLAALADWALGLPRAVRAAAPAAAAALAAVAAARLAWRGRRAAATAAVALWLEEREPALRYALVTALEAPAALPNAALEREVQRVRWTGTLTRAAAGALLPPAILLVAAVILAAMIPSGIMARVRHARPGDVLARPTATGAEPPSRLVPLVATVQPPAYTGETARVVEEPTSLTALAGSRVTLEGRGRAVGLVARLGDAALPVEDAGGRWRIVTAMPRRSAPLRLADGERQRLVILESRPDSSPMVTLTAPARDTVRRAAAGALALAAEARDDLGLSSAWLEYIVSSGEGESFTFRSGTLGRVAPRGARTVALRAVLRLDSLALSPGDVVHLRAVARDANDVTGPGVGASETRTLRVARRGEYDSVAVEGAPPPPPDTSEVSQRMLIMLAEALERRRPRLRRETVVSESRRIGSDQARLRRRVGEIIFIRLGEQSAEHSHTPGDGYEHGDRGGALSPEELLRAAEEATSQAAGEPLDFAEGESPVVAVNRPLLEAYNAMWDAGRELDIGEPRRALPHMRAALAAIQRARQAERIYLRGRPPAVVVDVRKVRLAGSIDSARAGPRTPRPAMDDPTVRALQRLDLLLDLLEQNPGAAVDSLLLLRLDLLEPAPRAAAAVAESAERLRHGRDATAALGRARRLLLGEPEARPSLPRWGGAW